MNNHPIKAFPLQQHLGNNGSKRVPSPGTINQYQSNRQADTNKKAMNHLFIDNFALNDDNSQMRRSKSSGILRKQEQNGNGIAQNISTKNKIGDNRGTSSSTKNPQDSILSSLQNILNNQTPLTKNANTPGSSHKRTQSTSLANSQLVVKSTKNNQLGNFNQYASDQNLTKSQIVLSQNGSNSVLNKSINKQQQQQQDYTQEYNNLKSLSAKNIYKPSTINQNRYTSLNSQNKNGVKGYTTIQNRMESNEKLPKLESLIQQQQQQMQPMLQIPLGQQNNLHVNNSINKGQSKDQLKSKLQNDLFKDNDSSNLLNSLVSNKNVKQQNNNTLQNSGLFSQGPKININLQIKNLNIISPTGLRNNNQASTNDNTPNNYQQDDSNLYDENLESSKQTGNINRLQHSRNPTQVINLQQGQNRLIAGGIKQNQSTPNIFLNSNQSQSNQNKVISGNGNNALVNGYSGYQQTVSKNQLQNQSESRQSSRRARSSSKDKNDSFQQMPKSSKSNQNPVDFLGKYANPFGKTNTNMTQQAKPQSQSIDAQRRSSKKAANSTFNDSKQSSQPIRKNSSHLPNQNQLNGNQTLEVSQIKQNPQITPKNFISSYAVRSKPGALPGKPVKTNQDSYIITNNFCKQKSKYFFSVCDGHGINGHHASQYVKKVLGPNIEFFMKQFCKEEFYQLESNQNPIENVSAITQALTSGYLKTAAGLLDSGIDITFSGSTCVGVYVTAERYWCANIGDSRAVIARQDPITNQWTNQPLSIDHKPDLPSEYNRILSSGGRVEPFKDMEGKPVGPARVWMRTENIPGLAMARSFGDYVASQVGVIPEPEILHYDISPNDKFLVVASDGIWEFLSNEEVVSMITPFYYKNDPEGACEKLVKEATLAWKREDEVIDDITIIVVFLNK
ncbi:protein phosphatase 2C containing protein (macronuclear) [Tetrahymena thermophila SB210]|uniref:Protein phosphatase 2C containing protein n=1 Tax=Tetrahymena thermophila (strain SB210) TaxID=312017 RepID=I7LW71_TETTS|nr:protein phosphatase 2C containing protein [Tetrahymena thermophila SB210]EAS01080.1 protein phosphatase 2C containing protein [Tetrahymena thermophila SB210]|eukprot:XP_001021325.1 protein phosphatase 2C containing protein [Tetrahymena thermophila SB210]